MAAEAVSGGVPRRASRRSTWSGASPWCRSARRQPRPDSGRRGDRCRPAPIGVGELEVGRELIDLAGGERGMRRRTARPEAASWAIPNRTQRWEGAHERAVTARYEGETERGGGLGEVELIAVGKVLEPERQPWQQPVAVGPSTPSQNSST